MMQGAEFLDQIAHLAGLPPSNFADVCDREAETLGLPPDHLAAAVEQARRARPNGKPPPVDEPAAAPELTRPAEPATPYPVAALGDLLTPAAQAINDKVQAPLAICGSSLLSASALATQGFADVVLPTGQRRPLSLYILSIAASGERKTSTDNEALAPIEERERELRMAHERALAPYEADLAAWKAERQAILADKKIRGREAKADAIQALGNPPVARCCRCSRRRSPPTRACADCSRAASPASACSRQRAGSSSAATP
jgi:hypothetical protein